MRRKCIIDALLTDFKTALDGDVRSGGEPHRGYIQAGMSDGQTCVLFFCFYQMGQAVWR